MTNIQVDIAGRSQGHSNGRSKRDARLYRSGFIPRKTQISEISTEKRGHMACESEDAEEADGSKVAKESASNNPCSEQKRPDVETEQDSLNFLGKVNQIQHVPSPPEVLSSSQMDVIPGGKEDEEDLDVDVGSLATGDGTLRFKEYWVPVHLSDFQLEQYCSILIANCSVLCSTKNDTLDCLQDVLNSLKKCCDHPFVLDTSLQASTHGISNDVVSAGIEVSGKIQFLSKFLPDIKKQQSKVLILYKTMDARKNHLKLGDILDDFICEKFGRNAYIHIYGGAYLGSKKMQTDLDIFNVKDNEKFVVLVEHGRSLRGIKLSSVDIVILFNSSWNPGYDLRALEQMPLETKSDCLRVFRLYSLSTLEEKSLVLAKKGRPITTYLKRNIHQLLMWGVTRLFTKLDELHGSAVSKLTLCPKAELLQSLIRELSTIMSSSSKNDSTNLISHIKKGEDGHYENRFLYDEPNIQSLDDELPHLFWPSLLQNKNPQWRFLPKQSETRKRRISCTFDKISESGDDLRKRSNVQREEEETGGSLVDFDTGPSQCYCTNDVIPSSSSKVDLINSDCPSNPLSSADKARDFEEACENVKLEKHDQEFVTREHLDAKNHIQRKVISNMCGEMAKEEEMDKLDKDNPNEQKHEIDKCEETAQNAVTANKQMAKPKCMDTPEEDVQVIRAQDMHHVQINLSSLLSTSEELDLGSGRIDQNNILSGATPSSEPMNSTINSIEVMLQKETGPLLCDVATVSPPKSSSIEREIIILDSDEEQSTDLPNQILTSKPSLNNLPNTDLPNQILTSKPSLNNLPNTDVGPIVAVGPSLQAQSRSSDPPLSRANIQPVRGGQGNEKTGMQLGSCLRTQDRADGGQDPLLLDLERLQKEKAELEKKYEGLVADIKSEYEKGLAELKRNYETSLGKMNAEFSRERTERIEYFVRVNANRLLAEALRQANDLEIWEPSEVAQENQLSSMLPGLAIHSLPVTSAGGAPLPGPAIHSRPVTSAGRVPPLPGPAAAHSLSVTSAGGALVRLSNQLTEPVLSRFGVTTQNPNMHRYGNHQPVHGSHFSAPYVRPLGRSEIRLRPSFSYSAPILGGQAVRSSHGGSLTSPHLHQPYHLGGTGEIYYRPF